jgi:hypothetical protein
MAACGASAGVRSVDTTAAVKAARVISGPTFHSVPHFLSPTPNRHERPQPTTEGHTTGMALPLEAEMDLQCRDE